MIFQRLLIGTNQEANVEIATPVSDAELLHAIELRCSECFGAMNFANALGGSETTEWKLVREYSFLVMVDEAIKRGLDVMGVKSAVDKRPIQETVIWKSYLAAKELGRTAE